MNVLIVDDEPLARERLSLLVQECNKEYKCFSAENGLTALESIHENKIKLVLMDIRMPVMDGLEAAQHILKLESPPSVIFTTAYNEYALDAFERKAVDYLLKPVRKERLQDALKRAAVLSNLDLQDIIKEDDNKPEKKHLSVATHGGLKLILAEDLIYLKAEQKYVTIHSIQGQDLSDESLSNLAEDFSAHLIRIHRNTLVAKKRMLKIEKNTEGQSVLFLDGVEEGLVISRRHLSEVKTVLKNLTI